MYEVTMSHPAIGEWKLSCKDDQVVWEAVAGAHRAQGQSPADYQDARRAVEDALAQVGAGGTGTVTALAVTITIELADESEYACQGHEGEDAVLLGGPKFCDGSCVPRPRPGGRVLADLAEVLDDAERRNACVRPAVEAAAE